jgi:ABC-type sugar transport system ATPase subunit
MADRIAVMRDGTVAEVLPRDEATQERILARALGETTREFKALAAPVLS